MNNFYDFIVIGAGISACTFAVSVNKRFPNASILLVEQGRRIGGRSTTRLSRKNKILEYDHGLPSINFSNNISKDLASIISPLIKSKVLIDITNDILLINERGDIDQTLVNEKFYRCLPFMFSFCNEMINQSRNRSKIDFLFQTFTQSVIRKDGLWQIKVNHKRLIRSKNLILSSSLLAHPRCLEILKIDSLPLRLAFKNGEDKIVDSLLKKISFQKYIKRKNYILYVPNSEIVKNFNHQYLQIFFSDSIKEYFNFERIIFQRQLDRSMIIVLHCYYTHGFFDISFDTIIQTLIRIFFKHKKFLDLYLNAQYFDKMDWRASQPISNLLPKDLQWSSASKIGFCGDWFEAGNCGKAEAAMLSSIRLTKLLTRNNY